jgi:peroxiredoxin
MLIPRQKTPSLIVPTLDHGSFDLSSEVSERGTVICFYRGLHCPICAKYLTEFEKKTAEFAERGVVHAKWLTKLKRKICVLVMIWI